MPESPRLLVARGLVSTLVDIEDRAALLNRWAVGRTGRGGARAISFDDGRRARPAHRVRDGADPARAEDGERGRVEDVIHHALRDPGEQEADVHHHRPRYLLAMEVRIPLRLIRYMFMLTRSDAQRKRPGLVLHQPRARRCWHLRPGHESGHQWRASGS